MGARIKAVKEQEHFQEWTSAPISRDDDPIKENPIHSLEI